jgi:hypothetical protein
MGSNRRRVEPTEDWEQIELLCGWPSRGIRSSSALRCLSVARLPSERGDPPSGTTPGRGSSPIRRGGCLREHPSQQLGPREHRVVAGR